MQFLAALSVIFVQENDSYKKVDYNVIDLVSQPFAFLVVQLTPVADDFRLLLLIWILKHL